jgi:endonuclease III
MTPSDTPRRRAAALLDQAGTTYAEDAGIRLADKPAPLWQLLVLSNLVSTRIKADIAVHAARELFAAGGGTPHGMAQLTWQERVDALGRGHYKRYDESTATRLGECADLIRERYHGDLRNLARAADGDRGHAEELLTEFPGIGPAGADIFCREAQDVWPFLRPVFDGKARDGAARVGLPTDPDELAELAEDAGKADGHGGGLAPFAAALVKAALDKGTAEHAAEAAGE